MSATTITVDVYCARSEGSPIYRVYVDDDLLTERNWSWPAYEVYIQEHIEVDVAPSPNDQLYVKLPADIEEVFLKEKLFDLAHCEESLITKLDDGIG